MTRARLIAAVVCAFAVAAAAAPAAAENWKASASVSATETYTNNVNYSPQGQTDSDFATSLAATLNIDGVGPRLKLNGSIGATALLYARETQNNSFAPQVNLSGTLEAIEKFAYVDAQAFVTQTFQTPFGAQPGNIVNATQNRYTQQTYSVSPYLKGVVGSTNVAYLLRFDNYWSIASDFGNSTTSIPTTYSNQLTGSLTRPPTPWGWTLEYNRSYYSSGLQDEAVRGRDSFITEIIRLILPYQVDPQLQIAPRIGYESNEYPLTSSRDTVYGIGGTWSPTDRTNVTGYWEHRFFGSSYSAQVSHRLPNSAISASFVRGITNYPQQVLFIPTGAVVSQFVDSAFTTRIPDPVERQQAVDQFLARTGLPPTLTSPVSFYAPNITLQESATVTFLLIGVLNSVSFNFFNTKSEGISGAGNVLPPALQFGQNNTQTGGGVAYSHRLSGLTNFAANASYNRTKANSTEGVLANARTNNAYANVSLNTQFGPKTSGSAGFGYSWTEFPGSINQGDTSALTIFATVSHTF